MLSEDEKKTQEYDKLAFRIVSYFTIPCLAGYTIYSLLYETHRGWYSFVITTLTSFVYMFGFVSVTSILVYVVGLSSRVGTTHPATHHQLQVEERCPHADEGHGVQITVYGELRRRIPSDIVLTCTLQVVDDLFA